MDLTIHLYKTTTNNPNLTNNPNKHTSSVPEPKLTCIYNLKQQQTKELQGLKEKFKGDDEVYESPYADLEKSTVLQVRNKQRKEK